MISLQLSDAWDLTLTPGGNLAVSTGVSRVGQDVASYERVFQGEGWYDQDAGIPYLLRELAELPPAELVRSRANNRAQEVPGVISVNTELLSLSGRVLSGVIRVTTTDGEEADVVL